MKIKKAEELKKKAEELNNFLKLKQNILSGLAKSVNNEDLTRVVDYDT